MCPREHSCCCGGVRGGRRWGVRLLWSSRLPRGPSSGGYDAGLEAHVSEGAWLLWGDAAGGLGGAPPHLRTRIARLESSTLLAGFPPARALPEGLRRPVLGLRRVYGCARQLYGLATRASGWVRA